MYVLHFERSQKMENSMSRILVETVVRKTLKDMKEDPERNIRNLVDMAAHFSGGRFQKDFFTAAQSMLKNENSTYYTLLRNILSSADTERLVTFGMNLGYNGCTIGANKIRRNEKQYGCCIPWSITIQTDGAQFSEHYPQYHAAVSEGERLGVYVWMLFAMSSPQNLLPLIREHSDSAFFLFCEPEDISAAFLDSILDIKNLMLVVRYAETSEALFAKIRNNGLLYSAYYFYAQKDTAAIINGDLFYGIQQVQPAFTVLLAQSGCLAPIQHVVHQAVEQARNDQRYQTIPWEFYFDNRLIDKIISDDACSVWFDSCGNLVAPMGKADETGDNLFDRGLLAVLQSASLRKTG